MTRSRGICPDAPRIASAIGRSKPDPTLRSSAGARLTVIRRRGHSSSAEAMPLRTRSFASWQARSARPTIAKLGIADWRCASTSTRRGSSPMRAYVIEFASTPVTVRAAGARVCHGTVPDVEQSLPVVTIRHAEPGDHGRVSAHLDAWWAAGRCGRCSRASSSSTSATRASSRRETGRSSASCAASSRRPVATRPTSTSSAGAAGRDVGRCVSAPVNEGSIAFHRRLGFEIEAEVADYDGAGEARALLGKRL